MLRYNRWEIDISTKLFANEHVNVGLSVQPNIISLPQYVIDTIDNIIVQLIDCIMARNAETDFISGLGALEGCVNRYLNRLDYPKIYTNLSSIQTGIRAVIHVRYQCAPEEFVEKLGKLNIQNADNQICWRTA